MPEFMITATWMVKGKDVEEAILGVSALLDEGKAAGADWSVFEPSGDEWVEYEIEWNEEELRDPDDQSPSGLVFEVGDYGDEFGEAEVEGAIILPEKEDATT